MIVTNVEILTGDFSGLDPRTDLLLQFLAKRLDHWMLLHNEVIVFVLHSNTFEHSKNVARNSLMMFELYYRLQRLYIVTIHVSVIWCVYPVFRCYQHLIFKGLTFRLALKILSSTIFYLLHFLQFILTSAQNITHCLN